ncbi:MAG: LamG-like jellyroll fold domain-containing protein [Caldilineaceae bacterium]
MILGQNKWFFGIVGTCNQKWEWGTSHTPFGDALVLDIMPDSLDKLVDVVSWTGGDMAIRNIDADGDGLIATRYGGADLDDTKWDQDGDTLSDGYELRVRSLPSDQGGAALSPSSADTDGDSVPDNVELRWGTDPANRDTDGDGLRDEQEIAPEGGWKIAYAYNAATGASNETLVWSNPTQSDADGDGMSDLFEQDQYILEPAPFADPTNPLIYNPNVWTESPVALYVTDGSTDGYVTPGATIAYTATTINNLSSGQQLVGELALSLPGGVTGSPLRQPVAINSGESGSLVSSVTFGSSTGDYDLTSAMSLTDFDQTRWSWAETNGAITQGLNGTPTAIAVEPVEGWDGAYLVAAIEKMSNGNEAISAYLVRSDGSLAGAPHSVLQSGSPTPHLNPDLACNDQGFCLLLVGRGTVVELIPFQGDYTNTAIGSIGMGGNVKGVSVASDGVNFMAASAAETTNGAQTVIRVTKLSSTGAPLVTNEAATLSGASGAAAIAWTGAGYKVVWTGDGAIHQADVNTDGVVSNASVVGAGSAWPQSDGNVHPLSVAFDEISEQALVAYRSSAGALAARRLGSSVSDEIIIASNGVSGDNVTVALSADPKNSGWVAAWTPSAGGQTAFSAISALGVARTNLSAVDQSTLTAVALACLEPRPLLQLDFAEAAGATIFADSSGHNHDATCGAACPEAGVSGKAGNAISFAASGQALLAEGVNLVNSSFTLAAWVAYRSFGSGSTMMAQGEYDPGGNNARGLYLGKRANDIVVCTMNDQIYAMSPEPLTDTRWHHWACTYETTTKRVTLYEDGQAIASATARGNYVGSGAFSIGTGPIFPGPLDASLDSVVVYDRALSAQEISDTFNTALAIYDLDEAPGSTTFVNAVPNGIDATCADAGCPGMGVEGKAFTAAHFDGSHFITIPAAPSAAETHYYTFDDGNVAGWSPGNTGLLAASVAGQSTSYLDSRHDSSSGNNIILNLSNLPQHDSVTISYDLYVLGSDWVGTQNRTASALRMQIDQVQVLETTFSNVSSAAQDYPNLEGWAAANSPTYPYKSGQVQKTLTVSGLGDDATAIYRISETYPHASAALSIAWYNAAQRRYGLDNVKIDVNQTNTSLPLKNASFTLAAWAKTDDPANQGYILSQGPGVANQGLRFGLQSGEAFCGFWSNSLRVNLTLDTEWHHWACTYDAATKQRTLYRDGEQIGQDTASSNYLGEGATAIGELFQGAIDEVGVFPATLTADDVKQLYEKVKLEDESTLICQLPLAQSNGQIAFGVLTLRETTTRLGDISQSLQRTLTVDADKPTTVEIDAAYFSQSAPGPYVRSSGALVFAGSASDDTSYITSVEVNDGRGWQKAAGTETWSYSWDTSGVNDGPQTLQVRAADAVGNQSTAAAWHTILDNTGPAVTVNGPIRVARPHRNSQGRWRVTVTGTASDPAAGGQPGSGVAAVEVLLRGSDKLQGLGWQPATLNSDGSWRLDYMLPVFDKHGAAVANPSGLYTATVRATDVVSNVTLAGASSANTFALDAAAPAVAASNSLASVQVITTSIEIGGPVSDEDVVQTVEINFTPGEQMGALEGSVLHLALDENEATEYFRDQSTANNNAACSGAQCPTVGQLGQRDKAARFDGAGQYLTAPNVLNPAATPFSAAAWFKVDAVGEVQYILQQSDGTGTGRTWLAVETDGVVRSFLGGSTLASTTKVSADTWYHAAVTYDGVTLKLYLDGMLEASAAKTLESSDGGLLIGAFKTLSDFYTGEIDELTIHDRALADYEVANLYAYGQGVWETATLSNGAWSYTIPAGDDGIEGIYQINVRGKDALGNVTQAGGQRVWRGEIDTKAPSVQFLVHTDSSGQVPTTRYECRVTDVNLLQESDANSLQTTSCVPGTAAGPFFPNSDVTLTQYGDVNLWYGAAFTETTRLYALDAVRTYTGTAVTAPTMTACDLYHHCTEVAAVSPPLASGSVSSELLTPSPGAVLTSLEPVTMSGDLYARDGLHALMVLVNGTPSHAQIWPENDDGVSSASTNAPTLRTHSSTWNFTWTPPGEGVYHIVTHLSDWAGRGSYWSFLPVIANGSGFALDQTPDEQNQPPSFENTNPIFLPLIAVAEGGQPGAKGTAASVAVSAPPVALAAATAAEIDPFSQDVSEVVAAGVLPAALEGVSGIFTHTIGTIYVDLTPPQVSIEPTVLTPAQQISRYTLTLTGQVSDQVQVQRVDVRIGDGAWQRAGLNDDGAWQLYWQFGDLRALTADQNVQITVRAADVAGRTTEVTETVIVQAD